MKNTYTYDDAMKSSVEYFQGDELAASVFVTKYALKNENGDLVEKTPADMHERLASEFSRIEEKYPNPMSKKEILDLLSDFKYIVPQGSPMSAVGNNAQVQSLSNCFVISPPYDSYGSIARADEEILQIQKRRGGVGIDISNIRPSGARVKNAAGTSGGISIFMERYSNTTREVAQGGRRGALMETIDVRHPDVESFINIKQNRDKVTGANVSVRVTDDFMRAVENNTEFVLRWPVLEDESNAKFKKSIVASDLWKKMMHAAWASAEPGILYWDTVTNWSMADEFADKGFKTICTNPCFVGSTLVATADGRNAVSFEVLAKEGKDVPVYSTNPETGCIEIKMGKFPRKTGTNKDVYKVTLDDNSSFKATGDHQIMLKDRSFKTVLNLRTGDSLFPFNTFVNNGYRQICNSGAKMTGGLHRNRRQYRLIHEFYHGSSIDSKIYAIHHDDHDSSNDVYENLVVMTHEEHQKLHTKNMLGDKNPSRRLMNDNWRQNISKSTKGKGNPRYIDVTNEKLVEIGKKVFHENGRLTKKMWHEYASRHNLPKVVGHEFRFGSWGNFKNQVVENHKVVKVEYCGKEDVYDLTVDDYHNFHIITSHVDSKYMTSSGVCVHNCSELPLSAYDSCRLLLINLISYVKNPYTKDAEFDYELFSEHAEKAQRIMDDLVDLEIEAIDKIIAKVKSDPEPEEEKSRELSLWMRVRTACVNGRRTGTGITALGDVIASLGHVYGSEESIAITERIYRTLAVATHTSSCKMAVERGAFPAWESGRYKNNKFYKRLASACDKSVNKSFEKYGRRNIALTTTAPAGSVSTITKTTSGIEPVYLTNYKRRKKLSDAEIAKGVTVDFVDSMGDKWHEFTVYHHGVKRWMEITGQSDISKSPYHKASSNEIDWIASVKLLAAAQNWTEHSISKTINLPSTVSEELVSQVYMMAWKLGIKGVTVYRDGSRSGVLISNSDKKSQDVNSELVIDNIVDRHAPKRPKELDCDIHRASVQGENYLVLVGQYKGRPYEVFAGLQEHVEVPKKSKFGTLIKNGKKDGIASYNLRIPVGDDDVLLFKDIVNLFDNPIYGAFTRTISLALRHGVPVQYLVEQLRKDKHSDVTSFSAVIARVLSKNYIPDGTKSSSEKICPSCKSENIQYLQGCISCLDCPYSKC